MMNKRISYFFVTIILLGITVFPRVARAQKSEAAIRQLLQKRNHQIKQLLGPKGTNYTKQQREKLKDIINGVMDYSAMAKVALQHTYDTLSVSQRKQFIDLFSTIVRDHSMKDLDIYRSQVTYDNISIHGDSATVKTTAIHNKMRTPVIYKLYYKNPPGKWVVTDLVLDDVSTVNSYRQQFQNIIQKKGYDYLLNVLKKRANQ